MLLAIFVAVSFTILISILLISRKLKLYEKVNYRKIHKHQILNTGGINIYFFYVLIIFLFEFNHNIELIIAIGFIILLLGYIDDRVNLNPSTKIIFIIVPSIYLILSGIAIDNLGFYENLGFINLGKFQIPFLILASCLLINATNYIDGIDGLLLTFFICFLSYYIFLLEDEKTIQLIKLLMIPVIISLIFNFLPTKSGFKIFSGNSGSLFIGFFISFTTINFYKEFNIHPSYLIWPLWYPVYDFLFVSINRLLRNKSVFFADKTHLHHKIFYLFKKNHFKTTLLFFLFNSSLIYFGFMISNLSNLLSLIIFIIGFIFYFTIRLKLK